MKKQHRTLLLTACIITGLTAGFCLGAAALLKNLGSILEASGETQFGAIFGQISDAPLQLPFYLPLILFGLYAVLYFFGQKKRSLIIKAGAVLFLLTFALTVLLTRVNGIRVWDVATSLLRYLENGIADAM